MNERIKELAKRCYETGPIGKDGWPEYSKFNEEKFAELIVRECLKLNKTRLASIPDDQKDWDGHNYGMTAAVYGFEDLVKEHFGIK